MVFQDAINHVSTSGFWAYLIGHDIILFAIAPTTTLATLLRRKQFVLQAIALLATMYLQPFDTYDPQTTLLEI
ncbi:hypothetical protein [Nostoc sp. NMS9]|uniref:hypothetical protein n=1 Tax=Nostoc sp. NMS9 TaxID=2815393 RepID=UPI0025FB3C60|nr:hypothetical protein [Nostoc sp. NMS9]MBN3940577.1 hypothetical protein [Nostoc sp. NMS9]